MTCFHNDFVKEVIQDLRNETNIILDANAVFSVRLSPDLDGISFLSYRLTPKYPNLTGITVIPVFDEPQKNGTLGIELVSPNRQIICQSSISLSQLESYKPAHIPFSVVRDSNLGVFELRIFSRNVRSAVRILEGRFLSPVRGLRRWRARPLCKLTFGEESQKDEKEQLESTSLWQDELTLELATAVGSTSLEDHYWTSGWQTADIQLITNLGINESIIDIGCGVGRLAYGLHGWYDGRYVGIDIVRNLIDYCKKNFPRFEFYHMDVSNSYYNPNGRIDPHDMVLPVEEKAFDVAVLFSVYSHLLPKTLLRMTSEVSRTLKPKGRCLATFFILDNMKENALFSFSHPYSEYCRVESLDVPETVVGYTKVFIVDTFAKYGLHAKTYFPGSWSGKEGLTPQDQILFVKA